MPAHCGDRNTTLEQFEPTQLYPAVYMGIQIAGHMRKFGKELILEDGTKIPSALDLFESFVVSILSQVKHYIEAENHNMIDYKKEAKFHHVLSDCRSELAMIQHVLMRQEDILEGLLEDNDHNGARPTNHREPLTDDSLRMRKLKSPPDCTPVRKAQAMLKRQQRRVQRIDGDAERIEKNVQELLNLKRTYTSVQDSHTSVLLSVAAIGFAVVTIIFAPLAFLTALFALNFQGFDRLRVKNNDGDRSGVVSSAMNNGDITVNVVASSGPAYDRGKMAGIFSELLPFSSI